MSQKTPGAFQKLGLIRFLGGPEVLDQWNPKIWNQGMKICWTSTWSVEPKIMGFYPPNHPFVHRAFSWFINHPFLGVKSPYFWKHPYKDNQNLTSNFWGWIPFFKVSFSKKSDPQDSRWLRTPKNLSIQKRSIATYRWDLVPFNFWWTFGVTRLSMAKEAILLWDHDCPATIVAREAAERAATG